MSNQDIQKFVDKKNYSIAFFNATNAAIELVSKQSDYQKAGCLLDERVKERISFWRDWFLQEHQSYYSKVVQNVGAPYHTEVTIAKARATTSKAELQKVWLDMSQNEREDPLIIKVVNELLAEYRKTDENIQLPAGDTRVVPEKKGSINRKHPKGANGNAKGA